MDLAEGIKRILDGEAILFIGAGFSSNAINIRGMSIKSGTTIANHFASLSNLPLGTRLEDAAEAYSDDFGIDALIDEVQKEFTVKEVQSYHRHIATLPWKRVYSTNYDNAFEIASRMEHKRVSPVTLSDDIYKIPKDHRLCVHFNGYVDRLDRAKILTELKLTDSSYVTAGVSNSDWAMLFRQDIKLASAIFFIGYSLYDLDIKKILIESEETKEKTFFYIGTEPDTITQKRVSRYGIMICESSESFVHKAQSMASSYKPKNRDEIRYLSVREVDASFVPTRITDNDFIELLLWGRRNESLVAESLRAGTTYYLQRTKIVQALDLISHGNRVIVISSDIGNGKSMFLEGLRIGAIGKGFRVFDLFDHNDGVDKELESISESREKTVVTIEEYQNWLDQIRLFCTIAGEQTTLVLSARNAIHDVLIDELTEIVGNKKIVEINIDDVNDDEIDWLIKALDQYGLWGEHAGLTKGQKYKYIKFQCQSQIHGLLVKLLSSPDIGKRISAIAERLRTKGDNYELLLCIFILTLLNYSPSLDILVDIWGTEKIGMPQFRNDPIVKEIVSFNYHNFLVRSPIVAEYILKSCSDAGTVVSILNIMATRIEKGRSITPLYNDIFKSLMRFSSLQLLLPEQGRRNAVIRYYESLKNVDACQNNPLFWLQYAIGSLIIDERPRAKKYFDTAYSLAEKKGWNTFQIDNHFSRYLMIEAIADSDFKAAMEKFRQARMIIDRQIRNERLHYPYRVAINFQEFINRFGIQMTISEINDFSITAQRIIERILTLPEDRRKNRHVTECHKAMQYVVNYCAELVQKVNKQGSGKSTTH